MSASIAAKIISFDATPSIGICLC